MDNNDNVNDLRMTERVVPPSDDDDDDKSDEKREIQLTENNEMMDASEMQLNKFAAAQVLLLASSEPEKPIVTDDNTEQSRNVESLVVGKEEFLDGNLDTAAEKKESINNKDDLLSANNNTFQQSNNTAAVLFTDDPTKITLKFLFVNRDGLNVTVDCKPTDTVGEVKGALLSIWPKELASCSGGDKLRLICMGKGILMPDSRSLEDCQVPVFKSYATPVNVSVKPENFVHGDEETAEKNVIGFPGTSSSFRGNRAGRRASAQNTASTRCSCVIL